MAFSEYYRFITDVIRTDFTVFLKCSEKSDFVNRIIVLDMKVWLLVHSILDNEIKISRLHMQAAYYVRVLILLNYAVTIRHSARSDPAAIRFSLCKYAVANWSSHFRIISLSIGNVKGNFKIFRLQQIGSPGVYVQPLLEFCRFYIKPVIDSNGWESVRVHQRIRMILTDAENLTQVLLCQQSLDLELHGWLLRRLLCHTVTSLYAQSRRIHAPYRTVPPPRRTLRSGTA